MCSNFKIPTSLSAFVGGEAGGAVSPGKKIVNEYTEGKEYFQVLSYAECPKTKGTKKRKDTRISVVNGDRGAKSQTREKPPLRAFQCEGRKDQELERGDEDLLLQ